MLNTYIVECSICGQPWEVPHPLVSAPGHYIQIPEHAMLDQKESTPLLFPCSGSQVSGLGLGERTHAYR
jgi:hypothetical protein